MSERMVLIARLSLAFLWISTGLTSVTFGRELGYSVLASAGMTGTLAHVAVYFGSLLDLILGFWILSGWRFHICCQLQIIVILVYSVLLTFIDYTFWFHPFGPITKNLPIIALILILKPR